MLSRALVIAIVGRISIPARDLVGEDLADHDARTGRAKRSCPARTIADAGRSRRSDGCCAGRAGQRVHRAGRNRQRPIERIGPAMGADDVAVGWVRHRADDRPALLRIAGAPADREAGGGGVRLGMRGEPDMGRAVGRVHGLSFTPKRTRLPKTIVWRALFLTTRANLSQSCGTVNGLLRRPLEPRPARLASSVLRMHVRRLVRL